MRKLQVIVLSSIFLIVYSTQAFAWQWPWAKKQEKPKAQQEQRISIPQIPEIPKPYIPRLPMAGKETPAGTSQAQEASAPKVNFGIAIGELISVDTTNPDNVQIKIKHQQGGELTVSAPPYLVITKRIKVTDLESGEKIMVHYIIDEEANKNTAVHITTGETPESNMPIPFPPPQNIPIRPEEEPKEME